MEATEIDLLSPSSFAGGHPLEQYAWLRDNAPVYRHDEPDGPGFWVVTRYDDVRAIGRDPESFSSQPTIMIEDPSPEAGNLLGDHQMMLMTDPPLHTRMRRLVSREFTPRAANALRPRVEELAARIVDAVVDGGNGSCDLVADLAGEMPSFVIADILGIPLEDGRELYQHTEALHSSRDAMEHGARARAYNSMFAYSQDVWADRRRNPRDDLATLLAHGEIDGASVDSVDFFLWFLLLVDAGGDTTRNLVGGAMWALFQRPEQLGALTGDLDELLPTAVEELLRWVSPVVYMRRTATREVELHGMRIAAGEKVVVYYGAANNDPRHFDRPTVLDLRRSPNQHIAFGGGGPHFCMGAHLARVEITALLREILTRLRHLGPTEEPTWMNSNFIHGPTRMPVSFDA
jgi:cytochrome P450